MKKIIVALMSFMLLFGSFSYAKGIAQQDAQLLFGNNAKTMQVATIDKSEMAKTEGEWLVYAVRFGWGALSSSVSYTVTNYGTSSWSWSGLGRSAAYGGIGGLFGWNKAASATIGAGVGAGLKRWGW